MCKDKCNKSSCDVFHSTTTSYRTARIDIIATTSDASCETTVDVLEFAGPTGELVGAKNNTNILRNTFYGLSNPLNTSLSCLV